jgi:N,N'-diacetyllegionaminate synthase
MEGPDHLASLEPDELTALVLGIRNIEMALGNSIKIPTESELRNINIARKSIHIAKDVKRGQVLTMNELTVKRPGNGISPLLLNEIVGCTAKKDLPIDSLLSFKDVEWK